MFYGFFFFFFDVLMLVVSREMRFFFFFLHVYLKELYSHVYKNVANDRSIVAFLET